MALFIKSCILPCGTCAIWGLHTLAKFGSDIVLSDVPYYDIVNVFVFVFHWVDFYSCLSMSCGQHVSSVLLLWCVFKHAFVAAV